MPICTKKYEICALCWYMQKCDNKWNMWQSHKCIKLTCLSSLQHCVCRVFSIIQETQDTHTHKHRYTTATDKLLCISRNIGILINHAMQLSTSMQTDCGKCQQPNEINFIIWATKTTSPCVCHARTVVLSTAVTVVARYFMYNQKAVWVAHTTSYPRSKYH